MKLKRLATWVSIPIIAGFISGCFPGQDIACDRYENAENYALIVADKCGDNDGVTTMQEKVRMWVDMGLHVEEVPDYNGGTYFKYKGRFYLKDLTKMYESYIKKKGYEIEYDKNEVMTGIKEKYDSYKDESGVYRR